MENPKPLSHCFPMKVLLWIAKGLWIFATIKLVCLPDPLPTAIQIVEDVSKWPTFFATCIFAFEGIIPLLHLKAQMRRQKALFGCNGVLLTTFYLIVICYFTMGFYGEFLPLQTFFCMRFDRVTTLDRHKMCLARVWRTAWRTDVRTHPLIKMQRRI